MTNGKETITINAIIDISVETLETIVKNEKEEVGFGKPGAGPVDTAGKVGELISRFLKENDFDGFANDRNNYVSKGIKIKF